MDVIAPQKSTVIRQPSVRLVISAMGLVALLSVGALVTAIVSLQRGHRDVTRYIDTARVMASYEPVVSADRELNTRRREWEKNLATLEGELDALVGDFLGPAEHKDERGRVEAVTALIRKEAEITRYRRAVTTGAADGAREVCART